MQKADDRQVDGGTSTPPRKKRRLSIRRGAMFLSVLNEFGEERAMRFDPEAHADWALRRARFTAGEGGDGG